ncbi:hypothetical protein [Smaragdicoccus niigatensis]|uniref:hypothetical protein n=1 Tax=Smaragdicoccus niigatensis TaxID=359359 RepID=UPI000367A293|nr:hypothetical protein [Smaragdicoccus niigatensis]
MASVGEWWDSVELWIAGLPFIPQFVLVLAVLIPVGFGIAWLLDVLVNAVLAALGRGFER